MKESFILYQSFYQSTKDLSDEKKGELYDAMFQYNAGVEVRELCPICQMAFNFMKTQFERDTEKYQSVVNRNRGNGAKGGRPRSNPEKPKIPSGLTGNPNNPEEPKKADTDTVDDTVTESEIKKSKSFSAPSLDDFKKYFAESGYSVDVAQRAFNGYDVAGWHDSEGKQIKSWKQKCQHVWFKPENKQKNTDEPAAKLNLNPAWQ